MKTRSFVLIIICLTSMLALSACQTAAAPPTAAPVIPTFVAATLLAPPTMAPQHPEARPDASRLDFSITTMVSSPGKLDPGRSVQAVFNAEAGRRISIKTTIETGMGGILSLWGADGRQLVPEIASVTDWEGTLPLTQDYYLNLRNTSSKPLTFRLTIKMPPIAQPAATRVQFKANSTSGSTQGDLPAGGRQRYVLRAMAGQQMDIRMETDGAEGDSHLYIWSADGTVYTQTAPVKQWSGMLPATQDYYIELVSTSTEPVAYRLTLTISAIETPVPPTPRPVVTPKIARDDIIRTDASPLDITLEGRVGNGERDRFTLNLVKGEKLEVVLTATKGNAVFNVLGPDGKTLPGTEESRNTRISSNIAPADGAYAILVNPVRGSAVYRLIVKVRK